MRGGAVGEQRGFNRQQARVMEYLETFGSITSMEAYRDLGIVKLSNRISELRQSGVPIVGKVEKSKNRFGEKVHYTRYTLEV